MTQRSYEVKVVENESDEPLKVKEDIIDLKDDLKFALTLETVLTGHEDKVFSVQWKLM